MATKAKKSTATKVRTIVKRAPRAFRRAARARVTVMDIVMLAGGAYVAAQYGHKVPIQDPRMRAGALAGLGLLVALKGPKSALYPALGVAAFGGASLLGSAMGTSTATPDPVADVPTDFIEEGEGGMGRMSRGRVEEIRRALKGGRGPELRGMYGRINGVRGGSVFARN